MAGRSSTASSPGSSFEAATKHFPFSSVSPAATGSLDRHPRRWKRPGRPDAKAVCAEFWVQPSWTESVEYLKSWSSLHISLIPSLLPGPSLDNSLFLLEIKHPPDPCHHGTDRDSGDLIELLVWCARFDGSFQ